VKPCDQNILRTIEVSQEMIRIADRGDAEREDTGCGVLYGILRDSAYKILKLAEEEKQRHQAKGWWQESCFDPVNGQSNSMHTQKDNPNQKEED
jgi:hypothetical protein